MGTQKPSRSLRAVHETNKLKKSPKSNHKNSTLIFKIRIKIVKTRKMNSKINRKNSNGRRVPRRPALPKLNIGQFTVNPHYSSENESSDNSYSSSSSSSRSSSPGSSSPSKIHDECNIYLGSEQDALDKDFIKSENIKHILSIQSWEIKDKLDDINYVFVKAADNSEQDLKSQFEFICDFLKQHENERVLVHCQAGISRSATACLAFLIKEKNMSLDSSFVELKKRRDIVCPNFSFLGQLKCWEREIMAC